MANSCVSSPYMESQCVIQPRRLKDFLQDQNLPFPRSRKLSTISVFLHAAVSSVKSSSVLRRSISRRFSKSTRINKNRSSSSSLSGLSEPTMTRTTSVTVKDILRWKSFRDLVDLEENNVPQPSEFIMESDSPSRCTSATTATTTSAGTPRSSWCDSDFTVGDSPVWCRGFSGDIEVTGKKNFHINVAAGEKLRQNTRDTKNQIIHEEEEDEQFSPISVLAFAQEHEETFSSFHQVLANMERRNVMLKQRIQEFENLIEDEDSCLLNKDVELDDLESFRVEEKAIQLMDHVKTTSLIEGCDDLLLDFFRDEMIMNKGVEIDESRVVRMAKSWMRGEDDGSLEWEMEGRREVCIQEMEKRGKWKDFEDEQQEIGIEIATMVFDHLLNELSMDLLNV